MWWCDLTNVQRDPNLPCELYKFEWDGNEHEGEVTRLTFTTSASRSGLIDNEREPLGQLLANQSDITSEIIQRWPRVGNDIETVIVKAPTDGSYLVKSETELDHSEVRITVAYPIEGQQAIDKHFSVYGAQEISGLWVKISFDPAEGRTKME